DCYFDAVQHLYTMCRHVKSIEIIEFGYEKSEEGVNGAKSESCVDKQRVNITRPYQAALREASISRQAVEGVRSLQEFWLDALVKLKWKPVEDDAELNARVDHGPRRRSRYRHRQDVCVSRSRAALRRQGHRVDGHQDSAGPALRA